jgi:hypothetical protein
MARYNTVFQTTSVTGSQTLTAATQGLTTTITGAAGVTITVPSPVLYVGYTQTYYNATAGSITLSTPSGLFTGPASSGTLNQTVPSQSTMTITADGTNYVVANIEGGVLVATTGTFSGTVALNGTTNAVSASHSVSAQYDIIPLGYLQTNYGKTWQVISSGYTAVAGDRLMVNTASGGFTVNLPASPARGDAVHFIDYGGTLASNNLTVNNNGNYIMRQNNTMTVSTNGAAFQLVFSGAQNPGWLVAQGI